MAATWNIEVEVSITTTPPNTVLTAQKDTYGG